MPLTPQTTDYLGYALAIIIAGGGLLGFLRRRSTISLIAGVISGGVHFYAAQRASVNNLDVIPALGISVALGTLMTVRFMQTNKFMPAGLIMCLETLMLCRYAIWYADAEVR